MKLSKASLLYTLLLLIVCCPTYAQEPQKFTTIADDDFKNYLSSPFANPAWDPFVKEGFDALDRNDIETSTEFLRRASNLGCESPLVYFKLALCYEFQGSYYSAIQYYELAQKQFQSSHQTHRYQNEFNQNYGRALYMMGRVEQAIPVLEKASQDPQTKAWVLQLLGQEAIEKKDHLKATAYFERLLKSDDSDLTSLQKIDIYIQLARAYNTQNEKQAAKNYYEKVLELNPGHLEAKQFLDSIKRNESFDKTFDILDQL